MSELGEDLEKLKREKRCLLHSMRSDKATIISLLEQTVSNDVINAIWANLESWSSCIETLQKVDDALMEFIDYSKGNGDKEEEKILKDYNDFRKDLILYKGKFKTVKDTLTPVESPRRGRASMMNSTFFEAQLTNPVIRLQDIPVPDFDGTIESYPDWFAEFENIVDKNEDLNDFQKMYLLRRCLTGKAKKYLIDFGTKGEYYLTAMEFIHKKFNNRRRIIAEHFHQLYHLPVMKSSNMRDTLDDVQRVIRGLNVCGIQTQAFSPFITYIVSLKIPEKLRIEWESSQHDFSCYPPFETMYSFLIDKCFAYETGPNRDKEKDSSNESKVATGSSVKGKQSGSKPSSVPEKKSFAGTKGQGPPPKTSSSPPSSFPPIVCVGCGEQHYLDMCKSFLNKSINDRFDFVKSNRLCLRCLKTGHNVAMCNRNIKCNLCSGNHHRLLHRETVRSNVRNEGAGMDGSGNGTSTGNASGSTGSANSGTSGQSNSGSTATSSLGSVCALGSSKSVFLATAVVKVQGVNCTEMGRIFLDQGSEMTLITREFCERAKLKMERSESPTMLVGITNDTVQLNYCVSCVLRSRYSNFSIAIKAEVVEKIPYAVNKSNVKSVIEGFSLQFGESTDLPYSSVDILLGSEYAEFVLKDKRHFVDGLVFRESYFGYVISGSAERCSFFGQKLSFCGMSNLELSEQFRKFVEVEEIPDPKKEKIVEHELIDKHFESTYSIDQETGKFVVRLPLKESVKVLNGSFGKVCAMLKKSEIRRSDVVQKAYETIFDEYLSLKHMTKLSGEPDLKAYYMPHHVVSKGEDSHRIVFNASFTDNSGTSLNSHFLVGPKVQPDLAVNLIRFRRHLIGFVCDIFRMYRDILIHPDDRIFQRIVFRFNFNDEIEVFELNTLANGIGPASYIAPKCLEKVASFIKDSDKMVSDIIMRDFYMDNLATGTDSVEGAIVISRRVHEVLMKYGFPLRKYQSNSPEFLAKISSELIDTVKVCNGKKFVTLLGLLWYLDLDEIGVDIREEVLPSIVTKRVMLSIISKTFDILGILTPVMIRAKLLLQDLWKEGRLWDEEISVELKEEFAQFLSDLLLLRSYSIPRCYFRNCAIVKVQLIGYCDASVRAACAVVYVRSIDPEGIIRVNFVCSKSRLAPPKGAVIHQMELIAAVLLAKLIKFVSLELCIEEIFCFSDSQVVLSWIKIDPVKLKQFVSNRVSVIKSLVDKSRWFYVEGLKNPADLGTRGITASKFLSSECWLKGANFLHENESFEQYVSVEFHLVEKIPEMKLENVCNVIAIVNHPVLSILNYKSSFYLSVSIVAWWIRYVRILRERCSRRKLGVWNKSLPSNDVERKEAMKKLDRLTNEERDAAYTQIIRVTQYAGFMQEQESLLKGKQVEKKSKLYACTVKLDPNGIIRATGRTVNASFEYDTKYPIVLPVDSRFLELYILFVHDRFHHANISFILNFIRAKFWIVGNLLSRIKFLIHRCVICVRENGKCQVQLMGDLPAERITVTRPFSYVGIDLTGALSLKCTNHRSVKSYKVYLVFFICMTTRAIHIEIVADLTTEEFLNSLVRFTSRRGLPCKIFSDNATNFVGALNVLNCSKFSKFLHENRIEWKTIAPRSPHQGGIWEAAVKAGKASLYRAIGNQRLTLLELHTVSTKVEAILNARPLAYRRNNSFVEPITPGHFLIGSAMFELPIDENASGVRIKERYFLWRRIVNSFWNTWKHDYFNQLRNRTKWKGEIRNLRVGEVVIVSVKNQSYFSWPLAIIEEVFPDDRGLVRNVNIRLADGEIRRSSVQNLVALPIENKE